MTPAMAMRCFCPPDSRWGAWWANFSMPTAAKASSTSPPYLLRGHAQFSGPKPRPPPRWRRSDCPSGTPCRCAAGSPAAASRPGCPYPPIHRAAAGQQHRVQVLGKVDLPPVVAQHHREAALLDLHRHAPQRGRWSPLRRRIGVGQILCLYHHCHKAQFLSFCLLAAPAARCAAGQRHAAGGAGQAQLVPRYLAAELLPPTSICNMYPSTDGRGRWYSCSGSRTAACPTAPGRTAAQGEQTLLQLPHLAGRPAPVAGRVHDDGVIRLAPGVSPAPRTWRSRPRSTAPALPPGR